MSSTKFQNSNCQCSRFAKKNPIIRIFRIFGWLAFSINPDKWNSTVLISCPKPHDTAPQSNCMQHSPSWEANSSSASQETFRIQWNLKVHYSVHNSPSPVPNLGQSNLVHFPQFHVSKIYSNITLPSKPYCLPSGLFHSGLSLHAPLLSPIRAICSAHLVLNMMTPIYRKYRTWSLSLCVLHSPVTSPLLSLFAQYSRTPSAYVLLI